TPDVAGVEPAAALEYFRGGFRLLEVPLGDVRPAEDDLAVGGDLHLDTLERLADRAELEAVRPVERAHGARLGEPVALEDHDARGMEELRDVARERCAAGDGPLQTSAEPGMELREDERVGDLALELEERRHRLAALLVAAHLAPDAQRPVEDLL